MTNRLESAFHACFHTTPFLFEQIQSVQEKKHGSLEGREREEKRESSRA